MAKYFTRDELACSHCGEYKFDDDFLELLDTLREECGFPFPVSSGYRCPLHPIEAAKRHPGAHTTGRAVDIAVSHGQAYKLLEVAIAHGVPRIGVQQNGDGRFIHLDWDVTRPYPRVWSY